MMCAFSLFNLGYNLIPILSSIWKVGGMTLIAAVFLFAFAHALMSLDSTHSCTMVDADCSSREAFDWIADSILRTFRLLVLADGVGIDWLVNMGDGFILEVA